MSFNAERKDKIAWHLNNAVEEARDITDERESREIREKLNEVKLFLDNQTDEVEN